MQVVNKERKKEGEKSIFIYIQVEKKKPKRNGIFLLKKMIGKIFFQKKKKKKICEGKKKVMIKIGAKIFFKKAKKKNLNTVLLRYFPGFFFLSFLLFYSPSLGHVLIVICLSFKRKAFFFSQLFTFCKRQKSKKPFNFKIQPSPFFSIFVLYVRARHSFFSFSLFPPSFCFFFSVRSLLERIGSLSPFLFLFFYLRLA